MYVVMVRPGVYRVREEMGMKAYAALHRPDGAELAASGYRRAEFWTDKATHWPDASADWGEVAWVSVWTDECGGTCISDPKLQPLAPACPPRHDKRPEGLPRDGSG